MKPFFQKKTLIFYTMSSELKKPNSFKLLEAEQDDDFFRIPPMSPTQVFGTRQSKGHIIEAKILRSLQNYQSAGNMLDTFFSGMVRTAIAITGGGTASVGRRKLSPDMDRTGAGR
jgi:hypothetical protein